MMKEMLIRSVAVLSALLLSITMPAQDIPSLPSDKAVTSGVLPNGMAYYLVSNKASLGRADFALVQKTGTDNRVDTSALDPLHVAKSALTSLQRINGTSPQTFAIRQGAMPSKDGFVTVGPDATIFRFDGIQVGRGQEVVDSTLLLLMDITDRITSSADSSGLRKWYSPSDQAVVISGDIDIQSVAGKLRMLSYMTSSYPSAERRQYTWSDRKVEYEVNEGTEGLAQISATWFSQRTPAHLMPTIHPAIFEMYVESIGEIVADRLSQRMRDQGMPVADISYEYVKSAQTCGDESFTVSFATESHCGEAALSLFAGIMSALESGLTSVAEYRHSKVEFIDALIAECRPGTTSNEEYIDRCISSFLYNASLASPQEELGFHTSRHMPDSTGRELLNDFASALLGADKNLSVSCSGFDCDAESVFAAGWSRPDTVHYVRTEASDMPVIPVEKPKIKVKSVKPDHLSGGSIITFSNDVKVVYKKMNLGDRLYYTLALNGGYMSVPDLQPGEGAYMSDFPMMCRIAGADAPDFLDSLKEKGMTMDFDVSMSNTVISGCLQDDDIHLLMESLLAFLTKREADPEKLEYYRSCEELALKTPDGLRSSKMAVIDNIMCPNYVYSSHKMSGRISDEFITKADALFSNISGKLNDGVLVIVGDLDIEELKKVLLPYVACMGTKSVVNKRTDVRYQPISSLATHTVTGTSNSIEVAMSTRMPVTVENYMASSIAAKVLSYNVVKAFREMGVYTSVTHSCSIYPEERFHVLVSVAEASGDGFAYGMKQESHLKLLFDVREAVSDLKNLEVTDDLLKIYKASLKNEIATRMNDPLYWTNAIAVRYLDGKDWTTNYQSKIDAVTASQVKAILASLDEGCKVEYVTRK